MGEMGRLGGEIKYADSAPKTEYNSEIWGKGVCDIWEKWVVWVEKSNTFARGEGKKKEEAKRYHSLGRRDMPVDV